MTRWILRKLTSLLINLKKEIEELEFEEGKPKSKVILDGNFDEKYKLENILVENEYPADLGNPLF